MLALKKTLKHIYMRLFDMLTNTDIKRIKEDHGKLALTKRIEELDKSLSIALEINDNYQRDNKKLKDQVNAAEGEVHDKEFDEYFDTHPLLKSLH